MREALVMALFFALSLYLARREGLLRDRARSFAAAAALALAFALRWCMLDYRTLDYENFLHPWVEFFRQNGGPGALRYSVGNYNIPYLFFLALFSFTEYPDLYLIKFLSIAFDVLLAWGVQRCLSLVTESAGRRLGAYVATLLLPTVLLNGALWGQCDSIYVALAVTSLYCALSRRPRLSLALITLSFALKLQAVFFLPCFLPLFTSRRIRWRELWVPPVVYLAAVSPAVLAGRGLWDTLTIYLAQGGTVGSGLNYNSPSLYAFYTGGGDEAALGRAGIVGAFLFCLVLLGVLLWLRERCTERILLCAFALCVICVPLLLPHMHDRYFFGADVMSLLLAFLSPALLPLPFLCSFASLLGYHAYLRMRYLLPMRYGAVALCLAAALIAFYMGRELSPRPRRDKKA